MVISTLFDKSFLQSLSLDESVWFDQFFLANVCPLFYVETLADLKKPSRPGKRPEDEVAIIADKFPGMHGAPNVHHVTACEAELLGYPLALDGRPLLANAQPVKQGKLSGVVIDELPEAAAFLRWKNREFTALERQSAAIWRKQIAELDLSSVEQLLKRLDIDANKCRTLDEAACLARQVVSSQDRSADKMHLALIFLGINRSLHREIHKRWSNSSYKPIPVYAPYVAHVLTVEIFFQIAMASNLISRDRPSNRMDIAYFFYLPFCKIFISSDNLHRKCSKVLLETTQRFVWGNDLKSDLRELNRHYSLYPDRIREQGIMSFATWPPADMDSLVAQLWDQFCPNWRNLSQVTIDNPTQTNKILENIRTISNAPPVHTEDMDFDVKNPNAMLVKRNFRKKKGSWYQLPKDLHNA